ncbi:MAG: hypothetical protein V7724_15670, partial [Sediminicola sp.]
MNKRFFLIIFLLLSGIAFSQTTVTLQDQCNCEVLSGTDVSAPGVSVPTGAELGDLYVNTTSGTIYFWDGNSWELTSDDNQQLQNFSFNPGTKVLSLTIEGGNTVSLDLSSLADTGTDDQNISTDGTAGNLSIEGGNAIALNVDDADSDPSNEYNTGISFDGANLTVTDAGGAQIVDISGVDTDGQDLTGASLGAGNILRIDIENGSSATVDLSSLVGTDDQTLGLASNTLSIEGGNEIDLSGYLDNTDSQDLSIVGDQLSIAGGNTVTVPTANGTETKVAAGPNVTVGGDGSSGSPYVIGVASLDDADADATNEIQDVSSADGSVTVTRTLDDFDLSVTFPANNDNSETNELTDLALSSDILRLTNPLTGGNEIDLSGY